MLDKSKIYAGYSIRYDRPGKDPIPKWQRVRILFEDTISYYVESLTEKDGRGFQKRYSAKKSWFFFKEIFLPVQKQDSPVQKQDSPVQKTPDLSTCRACKLSGFTPVRCFQKGGMCY